MGKEKINKEQMIIFEDLEEFLLKHGKPVAIYGLNSAFEDDGPKICMEYRLHTFCINQNWIEFRPLCEEHRKITSISDPKYREKVLSCIQNEIEKSAV